MCMISKVVKYIYIYIYFVTLQIIVRPTSLSAFSTPKNYLEYTIVVLYSTELRTLKLLKLTELFAHP